jgi:hypothetical protein
MTAAVIAALVLSACGGGGSSSGGGSTEASGGSGSASGSGGAASEAGGSTNADASSVKEAVLQEEVSSSEMFFAGEGAPFCEQFTAAGRKKVLAEIAQSLGVKASCPQVMGGLAKGIGAPVNQLKGELAELTPEDVAVHGSKAVITFPASAPVTLEESGGRWYITRGP